MHGALCSFSTTWKSQSHATAPQHQPERKQIAILGGGITGLTAAYYASKRFPDATITLFESTHRLGGVIDSIHTDVGDGSMVCDTGPRTLRANAPRAIVTLDLIRTLNLTAALHPIPRTHPAASTRFLLSPHHPTPTLLRLPTGGAHLLPTSLPPLSTLLNPLAHHHSPLTSLPSLARTLIPALLHDALLAPPRPRSLADESVLAFATRRWGARAAADLAAAVVQGVWAGEAGRLSARACLAGMWAAEGGLVGGRGWGGVVGRMVRGVEGGEAEEGEERFLRGLGEARRVGEGVGVGGLSVYTFKGGMGALTAAVEGEVRRRGNVGVVTGAVVTGVGAREGGVEVTVGGVAREFTHVVAATPVNHLISAAKLSLSTMQEATVMVVTLCYQKSRLNCPYHGFGYLVPPSVPRSLNPEQAIGVVFDSDALAGQDSSSGTKITVIIGGGYWAGLKEYPSKEEGTAMAKRVLERHLGLRDEPVAAVATLQRDAIPQYEVGYFERMKELRQELLTRFGGRVRVAGKCYAGIGVHDCIFSGRMVAERLDEEGLTGLEQFEKG
ncbi:Protoporphyrinogen oxidase [Neofusicoccum parvum]|nr:Protoporphyrinogen oxidase [Neofusicoccum parvum]